MQHATMQTVIQLQQHRVLCIAVEHAPEKHTPAATRCSRNDFPVPALPVKNTFSPDRTSCITRSCNMRALSMPIVMQASMPERTSTQLHDTTLHLFIAQLGADSVVCIENLNCGQAIPTLLLRCQLCVIDA